MRKLKLVLGICLIGLFLVSCQTVGTNAVKVSMPETIYSEGFLNIMEIIDTWNPGPMMTSIGGMPVYGFINPDEQQDIRYVAVIVYQNMPVGYAYLLQGEPYVYFITEVGNFEILPDVDKKQWKANFEMMFLLEEV